MAKLRTIVFKLYFAVLTSLLCIGFMPFFLLPRRFTVYGAGIWCWLVIKGLRLITGVKYELEGLEHIQKRPVIIASQHQSMWETLVLYSRFMHPNFVLKKELTQIPIFGWYLTLAENIPVKRGGGASALKGMLAHVKDRLNKNRIIVIFPHGTRAKPGEAKPLHPGITAIYRSLPKDSDIHVVPATLNSGAHWPKRGTITPGTIRWTFHEPIQGGLDKNVFIAQLEATLNHSPPSEKKHER